MAGSDQMKRASVNLVAPPPPPPLYPGEQPHLQFERWADTVEAFGAEVTSILPDSPERAGILEQLHDSKIKGEKALFDAAKRSKTATLQIGDVKVYLQVAPDGTPHLVVSELALAAGLVKVTGGEDGGIQDFGREHLIKNRNIH